MGGGAKAHLLTAFASEGRERHGIDDPFGGPLAAYRSTYEELDREVRRALDRLVVPRGPDAGPPTP